MRLVVIKPKTVVYNEGRNMLQATFASLVLIAWTRTRRQIPATRCCRMTSASVATMMTTTRARISTATMAGAASATASAAGCSNTTASALMTSSEMTAPYVSSLSLFLQQILVHVHDVVYNVRYLFSNIHLSYLFIVLQVDYDHRVIYSQSLPRRHGLL